MPSPTRSPLLLIFPDHPETIVGIDEVGRGCLGGPVVAAAVVLGRPVPGVRDSKKLSAAARARLEPQIHAAALAWGVGEASPAEIDTHNILQATFLAMRRALAGVQAQAAAAGVRTVWVDGNQVPPGMPSGWAVETYIGGDDLYAPIAAASVLAKEHRDRLMAALDASEPAYGWARHKGYGTPEHLQALASNGPSPAHRASFAPIARLTPRPRGPF